MPRLREWQANPRISCASDRLYDFEFDAFQVAACTTLTGRERGAGRHPHRVGQDRGGRVRRPPRPGPGPQVLLQRAVQGPLQPEVRRPVPPLRRRAEGRLADRRQQHQRRRACRGDDHRGPCEICSIRHRRLALGGLSYVVAGRGALPGRPVPRCGLGRSHHPPARVGPGRRAVRDREQRGGVRRLAGAGTGGTQVIVLGTEHRPVPLWQHMLAGNRPPLRPCSPTTSTRTSTRS